MHTRAAIYLRISEDRYDDKLAITRQRAECLQILKSRDWLLAGEYVDNDQSASDRRRTRPEYERMRADFLAGLFEAIVCYDLDRLTRQPRQLEDWIDAAEQQNLKLVTANGEADLSSEFGRMFARVKAAVARSEIETKARRQRSQIAQRLASGLPIAGGKRRFGFEGDHVTPRTSEAIIVRQMFEDIAAGGSLHRIQADLNAAGVSTAYGYRWDAPKVRKILTNGAYKGALTHKGVEIPTDRVPSLVPPDLWEAVNAILRDPRRRVTPGPAVRTGLLAGIATCGVCGAPMRSATNTQRGKTAKLYKCSAQILGHASGTHPTVRRHIVDDAIAAELFRPVLTGQVGAGGRSEMFGLLGELADINARRERAMNLYIDDGDLQAHKAYAALGVKAEARQARLSILRANDAAASLIEGFESRTREWIRMATSEERTASFDEVQKEFIERFRSAAIETKRSLVMARFSEIRIYPASTVPRLVTVARALDDVPS